jgi:Acetyltransferase (GNAT) domain
VISELDALEWTKQEIGIPLMVGEVCLWRAVCKGIRSSPDIFAMPPLSLLRPPIAAMSKEQVQMAYLYSCPVLPNVSRLSVSGRHLCIVDATYKHYYVETRGSFEKYLASKNKKTVSTLRRKTKKIEDLSQRETCFKVYSSPTELEEFLALAIPVSDKSYQQRLLGQGLPKTQQFKDSILAKGSRGEILGYILKIGEYPVAYNLCPRYGGGNKILYDQTGYDPDFSNYSPGTVLQFKIIEDLFKREGIDYYDLCTGEGIHKEIFATGHIFCGNAYFFPLTIKYLAIFATKFMLATTISCVKNLLDRVGLKAVIKKYIRGSA